MRRKGFCNILLGERKEGVAARETPGRKRKRSKSGAYFLPADLEMELLQSHSSEQCPLRKKGKKETSRVAHVMQFTSWLRVPISGTVPSARPVARSMYSRKGARGRVLKQWAYHLLSGASEAGGRQGATITIADDDELNKN